jgi:hypothetical protein
MFKITHGIKKNSHVVTFVHLSDMHKNTNLSDM